MKLVIYQLQTGIRKLYKSAVSSQQSTISLFAYCRLPIADLYVYMKRHVKSQNLFANLISFGILIGLLCIITGCSFEKKHHYDNGVQGYHWLGVTGNEEIRNDTIFNYDINGGNKFSYHIIKKVTDSTITYQYYNHETDNLSEHTVTYEHKLIDKNPYLIIYHQASVSMFTRKRTCPFKFRSLF